MSDSSGDQKRRQTRRRKLLLDLGMPFEQLDQFLNQSEDAVALGYRVLEDVVEEVRQGYHEAQAFNKRRREWNGTGRAPMPWQDLVKRLSNFQRIASAAVTDSVKIANETASSITEGVRDVVDTFERSQGDASGAPTLSGPVFEDIITIDAVQGRKTEVVTRQIRHVGLARLRIHAQAPPLKEVTGGSKGPDKTYQELGIARVSFAPVDGDAGEHTSELKVDVGRVSSEQPPGTYEGLITAKNFQLLIGRVRVRVAESGKTSRGAAQQEE